MPHRPRARIGSKTPVHVTLRLVREVRNLRRSKLASTMRKAFAATANEQEFRLCQFSIQRDHLHLACEADSNEGLARGIQAVEISFAKRVNATLGRKGKAARKLYPTREQWLGMAQ